MSTIFINNTITTLYNNESIPNILVCCISNITDENKDNPMDTHIHIPYANNGMAIRKYIFPLRNIVVYGSITAQNKIISENANDITK